MDNSERRKFVLRDRYGSEHTYLCLPHPWSSGGGLKLLLEITSVLGEGISKAIKTLLSLDLDEVDPDKGDYGVDIDMSSLSDGLASIPERLLERGGQELICKIFAFTRRDGLDLDKPHDLDRAFTANYGEMCLAIGHVLEINYSPFGPTDTLSWKGRLFDAVKPGKKRTETSEG